MITTADHNGNLRETVDLALATGDDVWIDKKGCVPEHDSIKIEEFRDKYRQVSLLIKGESRFWDKGNKSVCKFTFSDKPYFAIQQGKGVELRNINIQGPANANTTGKNTRYDLNAGVSIDYADPRKKGDTAQSGSTGCIIDTVTITNAIAGIVCSVNGYTQNGDNMTYSNIRLQNVKYGIVGCQDQEKNNLLENICCWTSCDTVLNFNTYGARSAGQYKWNRGNIAGPDKLIHRASGGSFPLHISNLFIENLKELGYWDTILDDKITDSVIHFRPPAVSGFPNAHLTGKGVTFTGNTMRIYGMPDVPLLLAARGNKYNPAHVEGYVPPVKGVYNNNSDPDYTPGMFEKITRGSVQVTNGQAQLKGVKKGDIILFSTMGNQSWAGMGKSEADGVINYLSPGIKTGETYDIGKFRA